MSHVAAWLLAGLQLAFWALPAPAAECGRDQFAAVVDDAGRVLRQLNASNTAPFQARLRRLRVARKWNQKEFLAKAEPFVRDDRITAFDDLSEALLGKINMLGGGEEHDPRDNCRLLGELKGHMNKLVETMQAKWSYMFEKVDKALKNTAN